MIPRMVAGLLALAGLFVSAYLTLFQIGALGELTCAVGACETVQLSPWSRLFGIPVAAWGVGFYVTVLAVSLAGLHPRLAESRAVAVWLVALAGFGVLFSAWLTYLELFVIRAICMWCVVSAFLVVAILAAGVADLRGMTAKTELTI